MMMCAAAVGWGTFGLMGRIRSNNRQEEQNQHQQFGRGLVIGVK